MTVIDNSNNKQKTKSRHTFAFFIS